MSFLDYLTRTALSMTVSGNTGISPFLTLLLLGVVEVANPELLNMGETMENVLASWYSIAILSVLTLCEFIGKCIPAVDEIIDSAEVFVVPALSVMATLGTVGVFDAVVSAATGDADDGSNLTEASDGERNLGDAREGFLTAWKVFLVLFGIVLSLLIHFFKMIIRVAGLVCCMGCCQPCITVIEATIVCCGVVFAILVGPIAILLCAVFLIAATYALIYKCRQRKENAAQEQAPQNSNQTAPNNDPANQSPATIPTNPEPAKIPEIKNTKGSEPSSNDEIHSSSSKGHDAENPQPLPPPISPSAPQGDQPITYAEATPMAPPATNPNFVCSDNVQAEPEIPIAVAVEVVAPPNADPTAKPDNSAVVY